MPDGREVTLADLSEETGNDYRRFPRRIETDFPGSKLFSSENLTSGGQRRTQSVPYRGKRSSNPLLCLEANASLLWDTELRPGHAGPGAGRVELLASGGASRPAEGRELRVRADAGFGANPGLDLLEARPAHYAVVARRTPGLKRKLGALRYQRGHPLWEIAEWELRLSGWSQSRRFIGARRRLERREPEPTLFHMGHDL